MSSIYLTLAPIIFPIFTGFALFSRPIFEDRHIYNDAHKNFTAPKPTALYNFTMLGFLTLNFYLGLFFIPLLRLITRGVNVL